MKQGVKYCSHAIVCRLSGTDERHCLGLLDGIIREEAGIRQRAYSLYGRFIWS